MVYYIILFLLLCIVGNNFIFRKAKMFALFNSKISSFFKTVGNAFETTDTPQTTYRHHHNHHNHHNNHQPLTAANSSDKRHNHNHHHNNHHHYHHHPNHHTNTNAKEITTTLLSVRGLSNKPMHRTPYSFMEQVNTH